MDQKHTNDTMFEYYKDLNENLALLTQKTKEQKSNKVNFTSRTHTVFVIELQSNKKVTNHQFLHQPPFSVPPKSINFCWSYPLPPLL